MRMRVFCLFVLVFLTCLSLHLSAQVDSTFVRYYSPTYETHPYWDSFPSSQTLAANVFEDYEGKFVLQAKATFHSPPPEWVFPQSPMMFFTRNGDYQTTMFGPQFGGDIVEGYYSKIVKDGLGGYFALDSHYGRLHRLDNNLQYVEWIHLTYNQGQINHIDDILPVDSGYIIIGHIQGTNDALFFKVDYFLDVVWLYQSPANIDATIGSTSDGSILFNWGFNPSMRLMKITADGDSLWTVEYPPRPCVERIIESNGSYYGIRYYPDTIDNGLLKVYDYGTDFSIVNPDIPILTIPTYSLLDVERVFPAIRTSDNNIVIAVSTPTGEIFKFDSNFNLLWSSNALQNERVGIGFHPLIELGNSDLLYCATVGYQPRQLALVRIDSNGDYVGIENDTEQTPAIRRISAYPNPFSDKSSITVKAPEPGAYKLNIYNIKGQKIRSYGNSSQTSGDHTFHWDGRDETGRQVSGGIYFAVVEAGRYMASSKILYMK